MQVMHKFVLVCQKSTISRGNALDPKAICGEEDLFFEK
jgi:hypothetical protein